MSKKRQAHLEIYCSNVLPVTQRTTKDKTSTCFKKQQDKAKKKKKSQRTVPQME